jgi:F1F0 ATPase subunit 2
MITSLGADLIGLSLALVAGIILGCGFFYSLWFTVQKGLQSHYAALWFLGGVIVRMSVAILVFYWVSSGDVGRMVSCLVGFILGRLLVTKYLAMREKTAQLKGDLSNAP